MKKAVVISVHPDDETLGCGGTILKLKSQGVDVCCVFVTNGNSEQSKIIPQLSEIYGFYKIYKLGLKELLLDDMSLNELIPLFSDIVNTEKPELILLPNRCDVHSDHRKVFEAMQSCIKSFRYPFIKKVLMCEVISETDFSPALPENVFIPNVFVDISAFIHIKREAINVFKNELLVSPQTRSLVSIEALSRYRGSQINAEFAEAFMLLKEIL